MSAGPRQLVILPRDGAADLGSRRAITERLATMNTMAETPGEEVLWGPGVILQLPPDRDPVDQILVLVVEEEISHHLIRRLLREFPWRMVDLESGQEFGAATAQRGEA